MKRAAGLCWLASLLYFPISAIVAIQWNPGYSIRNNFISDLAVTSCGQYPERDGVCSPWHALMNVNLVLVGVFIAAGAALWCWQESGRVRIPLIGLIAAGSASALVGFLPLNLDPGPHTAAATTFLVLHVVAMAGLAVVLRSHRTFVLWTIACVAVSLLGVTALETNGHFGLGIGLSERLALDVLAVWRAGVAAALIRGITFGANHPNAGRSHAGRPNAGRSHAAHLSDQTQP